MNEQVLLGHGSGGKLSHQLISDLFFKYFSNEILENQSDSAILSLENESIAFTTDSYVVDPIFFPGGNIGKLAVCGTVNDLSVSGAIPKYLSVSFILEEGFPIKELETIVITMAEEAKKAAAKIVTGDTKVVNKGKCNKIFINTSGIGILNKEYTHISLGSNIQEGDQIIINGCIGDHGMTILKAREFEMFKADIQSDCASLNDLIQEILKNTKGIRFMRDATRGGLASILAEIVKGRKFGIEILEEKIPIKEQIRGMCELLGFDPLYVANEGKVVLIVSKEESEKVLNILHQHALGKESSIIRSITNSHPVKSWLQTVSGGIRMIDMLSGEHLPRIC
jgi:hydrogenase expression/formation protein HypE